MCSLLGLKIEVMKQPKTQDLVPNSYQLHDKINTRSIKLK